MFRRSRVSVLYKRFNLVLMHYFSAVKQTYTKLHVVSVAWLVHLFVWTHIRFWSAQEKSTVVLLRIILLHKLCVSASRAKLDILLELSKTMLTLHQWFPTRDILPQVGKYGLICTTATTIVLPQKGEKLQKTRN